MLIIELSPLSNGAHRNQTTSSTISIPDGWAVVPDSIVIPDTFPFVDVEADGQEVISMTAGIVPEPEPMPEPEPTDTEVLNTLLGVSE